MVAKYLCGRPILLVLLVFLGSALAYTPLRLNSSKVYPTHYEVQLQLNTLGFTGVVSIDLNILEDTQDIQLNNRFVDLSLALTSLVQKSTGDVFKPEYIISERSDINEVSTFHFDQVIPAGSSYTLVMAQISGDFKNGFEEINLGSGGYLLSTGTNLTGLRSVFPCFDEPAFRATFNFVVRYSASYSFVASASNVIIVDDPEISNGKRATFQITNPQATSSIGFLISTFPVLTETNNRVSVYHPDGSSRRFLAESFPLAFEEAEGTLNLQQLVPKLSVIYVPSLITPFATKWGLIFVSDAMIPASNDQLYSLELKEIQKLITRSVYEMFFTGIMSPVWWDNRWVSRGLSSYFASLSKSFPFDAEQEFLLDSVYKAIREDFYPYANLPLKEIISDLNNINSPNPLIVQHKAGSIMRMISDIMGVQNFTSAVLDFVKESQFGTITSKQFLDKLDLFCPAEFLPEGYSLSSIIHGYETEGFQNSYWYVTVAEKDGNFTIARYLYNVPVAAPIYYETYPKNDLSSKPQFWSLPGNVEEIHIAKTTEDSIILVNPDQFGLYQVIYENSLHSKIVNQLMKDHSVIRNRWQLIADSLIEANSWGSDALQYFDLIKYLSRETDSLTWRVARQSFEEMFFHLRGIQEEAKLIQFYSSLVDMPYKNNSLKVGQMENFETTMQLAKIACATGNENCVQDVQMIVNETVKDNMLLSGPEDYQYLIYCTLARYVPNGDEVFINLIRAVPQNGDLQGLKVALKGLGCSADENTIKKFLAWPMSGVLEGQQTPLTEQDKLLVLQSFLGGSYEATLHTLQFIQDNFPELLTKTWINELFENSGEYVRNSQQLRPYQYVINTYRQSVSESLRNIFDMQYVVAAQNTQLLSLYEAPINDWLNENVSGIGNSLRSFGIISVISAIFAIRYLFN